MKNLSAFVVSAAAVAQSFAIVPNNGPDSEFQWVGRAAGGSGTAISRRSVITAKHATGSQYEIMGTVYTAAYRIDHPTMDIAILVFDEDLPGWHQLGTQAPVGTPISMVGLGRTGIVNSEGTGYDIYWSSGGTRLAAPGDVDLKWFFPGFGPSLISWLEVNGDGAVVSGDSGGGYFIDGKLVGVVSYAFNNTGGVLPDYGFASLNGGVPYMGTGAIDLTDPEVRAWVLDNVVPEIEECAADYNADTELDVLDFLDFFDDFGTCDQQPAPCGSLGDPDMNGDTIIDILDFLDFFEAFGQGC